LLRHDAIDWLATTVFEVTRFSQRVGGRPPFNSGLEEASQNLRTATWNVLHPRLFPEEQRSWDRYQKTAKMIWHHLHWRIDDVPHYVWDGRKTFREYWFGCPWREFFDAYEFAVMLLTPGTLRTVLLGRHC
jgi:hypothetical protein